MFIEGLIKLYIEQPEAFWMFIYTIAPSFGLAVLYGIYLESQDLNGRHPSGWIMFRAVLLLDVITLAWGCYLVGATPFDNLSVPDGCLVTLLYMTVTIAPIIGGMMTGLMLMRGYWYLMRAIHWFKTLRTE